MSYAFPVDLLGLSDGNSSAVSPSDSCRNGINSDAFVGFKSLRSLTFENVNMSGSVLQFFLHNCPFLEHLVVGNSISLEQFEVCGPSLALKHLEIIHCHKLLSLRVCHTNIVSLRVTRGDRLVLKNVPKLVDVNIHGLALTDLVGSAISWLSCCLSKLEFLTLKINHLQLQQEKYTQVALPRLTRLKQLTFLLSEPEDYSLIPFTSLIRASPNLEKFVLKTKRQHELWQRKRKEEPEPRRDHLWLFPSSSRLQHLKVVELYGFYGHENEVELLK